MSHYSDNPSKCRVDFFKESGKWYCTEAVVFVKGTYKGTLIHDAFRTSLREHFKGESRLAGMRAVCLEPYHEHSHPISLIVPDFGAETARDKKEGST